MSTHLIYEYESTPIFQDFQVKEYEQLDRIAIGLYFHNDPAGSYKLSISTIDGELISKTYTMAEIITMGGWNAGEYHIGYTMFTFDTFVNLHPLVEYKITLEVTGYTFAPSSLVGVMIPHEDKLNGSEGAVLGYKLYNLIDGGNMRIVDFFDGQSSATQPTFEEIVVSVSGYYYLGDEDTDGSWRWHIAGGDMHYEKRIAGVWTLAETKEAIA